MATQRLGRSFLNPGYDCDYPAFMQKNRPYRIIDSQDSLGHPPMVVGLYCAHEVTFGSVWTFDPGWFPTTSVRYAMPA